MYVHINRCIFINPCGYSRPSILINNFASLMSWEYRTAARFHPNHLTHGLSHSGFDKYASSTDCAVNLWPHNQHVYRQAQNNRKSIICTHNLWDIQKTKKTTAAVENVHHHYGASSSVAPGLELIGGGL